MRQGVSNVLSSAGDASNVNGSQIDSNQLIAASFQIVFGGATAGGTFKIQGSNDIPPDYYQASTFTVTNWTDIPNATATITSGASALISLNPMAYRWVRAVWVHSSGGSVSESVNVNMFKLSL